MFEEQYRRDNERLHAPADALEKIRRRAEAALPRRHTAAWARYAAAAAALLLVAGGVLSGLLPAVGGGNDAQPAPEAALVRDAEADGAAAEDADVTAEGAPAGDTAGTAADAAGAPAALCADAPGGLAAVDGYDGLYAAVEGLLESADDRAFGTASVAANDALAADDTVNPEAPAGEADGAEIAPESADGAAAEPEEAAQAAADGADLVKTDGTYLYYLANGALYVVSAAGADTALLSRVAISLQKDGEACEPLALHLSGDRLVVLAEGQAAAWSGGEAEPRVQALVFDVSDPAAPRQLAAPGQSGSLVASYLSDGVLYLVTAQDVTGEPLRGEPRSYCPTLYDAAGEPAAMAAEDVHVRDGGGAAYTVVTAIDVSDGSLRAAQAILGGADAVYLNGTHLLVAWTEYGRTQEDLGTDAAGRGVRVTRGSADTALALFSAEGGALALTATATLPGRLPGPLALDEWDGVFRVATQVETWEAREYDDGTEAGAPEETRYACVYTLDAQLQPLGGLERLAEGAWLGSVRFAGPAAYLTASGEAEELLAVDLSDPVAPALLGTQGDAGLPACLRPFGEGLLLGLGDGVDEETDGARLSLLDVTDPADVRERFACAVDAAWTPADGAPRALLADAARALVAFPTDEAYLVYGCDAAAGFTLLASVALDAGAQGGAGVRGALLGDALYVLSGEGLTAVSTDGWYTLATIAF